MFENPKPDFAGGYAFTRQVAGRERQIEVDADMLTILWCGYKGPQTAQGIVEANLEFLDRLIVDIIAQSLADPAGDDPILISGVWYASEPDDGQIDRLSLDELKARLALSI